MEFLNDYLTWFQQNEETLKNMSPAKAKGKIIMVKKEFNEKDEKKDGEQ